MVHLGWIEAHIAHRESISALCPVKSIALLSGMHAVRGATVLVESFTNNRDG
jgi:hypothetical protein